MNSPTVQTILFVCLFFGGYLFFLLRKAIKNQIDVFDLFLLSAVASLPVIFVIFSDFMHTVSHFIGVAFPFVILFGLLFFVAFIYLYKIVVYINLLKNRNISLTQELSLLRHEMHEKNPSRFDD